MNQTIISALKRCPLFKDIAEQCLKSLLEGVCYKQIKLSRKEIYCLKGDVCTNVDIVINGEMTARMTGASGKQVEVIRLHPGEIVAPCFIFSTDKTLPVEIEAATTTSILRMHPNTLAHLIDINPTIRCNFIRAISDIGAYLASKINFLSLLTAREKVMHFLCSEAAKQHSRHVSLNLSRQNIADSFGIQKFSLLRCMSELAKEGIIKTNGREIVILDLNRLR